MALPEGTVLENRYILGRKLAEGGMGAIYQGYDTKLDLKVAIKENYLRTPESIQQFKQEAQILARLHHPNLPRVIDHFSFKRRQYLVMDFIEGLDLWELFKAQKQPLEEKEALDYLIQVCDAVSYLHRQSPPIIHRDIKPQNIKVTPDGRAVLVDFGIARVVDTGDRTKSGAQAITPGFSPPEQYGGMGTGPVSDIYSLGATLYAVLTGQYPPDSISRMAGGAKFQPPNVLNEKLSNYVSHAVEYAMQVKREDRPQSVLIWQQELKTIRDDLETAKSNRKGTILLSPLPLNEATSPDPETSLTSESQVQSSPANPPWLWIGLALVALAIAIGSVAYLLGQSGSRNSEVNTQAILLALAATATTQAQVGTTEPALNLEATLTSLAATATAQVLLQPQAEVLPGGTDETPALEPAVTPVPPPDTPTPELTATLTPSPFPPTPAPTLPASVSTPTSNPTGGGQIAFISNRTGDTDIYLMNGDGSEQVNLTNSPTTQDEAPVWSPDGQRLAFGSSNTAAQRSVANTNLRIIDLASGNLTTLTTQADQPTWSPDSRMMAVVGADNRLYLIEIESKTSSRLTPGNGLRPAWSPDGQWVVFDDNSDLYLISPDGNNLSQLAGSSADETRAAWSPDGRQVAFVSNGEGNNEIYVINADGTGGTRLTHHPADDRSPSWSPDGRRIAFASNREGNWDIYIMNADGSEVINLTQQPGNDLQPVWSP